jgi:hypothetical protein
MRALPWLLLASALVACGSSSSGGGGGASSTSASSSGSGGAAPCGATVPVCHYAVVCSSPSDCTPGAGDDEACSAFAECRSGSCCAGVGAPCNAPSDCCDGYACHRSRCAAPIAGDTSGNGCGGASAGGASSSGGAGGATGDADPCNVLARSTTSGSRASAEVDASAAYTTCDGTSGTVIVPRLEIPRLYLAAGGTWVDAAGDRFTLAVPACTLTIDRTGTLGPCEHHGLTVDLLGGSCRIDLGALGDGGCACTTSLTLDCDLAPYDGPRSG